MVHVQADGEPAVLRRFAREAGMSGARRLVLPLLVLAAAPLAAQQPAAPAAPEAKSFPDQIKSFGGVPFGAPLEEAKKVWQLEAVDGASVPGDPVSLYLREEESLVVGGLVAREVVYYFLNGKFYAVSFCTPDSRQTTILREALTEGYGSPAEQSEDGDSLVWPGKAVSAHLMLNPSGEARVVLFSNDLQPEYEKCLREAAAKTAVDISGGGSSPTPAPAVGGGKM